MTADLLAQDNLQDVEIPNTTIKMKGLRTRHPQAPAQKPFRFPEKEIRAIAAGIKLGCNILMTGPTGCGKSSLPIALASHLGRPIVRFNMNGETRVAQIVGQQRPASKDGVLTLTFSLGALAKALEEGWWVVLDEIEAALPSVLFVLQSVLEEGHRSIFIPELDRNIDAHPEFAIFATGNTLGYRASTRSKYSGTNVLNTAFLDRFGVVVDCGYPERKEEIQRVLAHVPDADQDYVDGICRVAEELRKDKNFKNDFSTRRCIQWARLLPEFDNDVITTSELAFVLKYESPTDAQISREVIGRIFGYSKEAR